MDQEFSGRDRHQRFIKIFLIFALGLWVGMWLRGKAEGGAFQQTVKYESATKEDTEIPGLKTEGLVLTGGNAIVVDDQAPGNKVNVAMVTLAKNGWAVIHSDTDGKPGRILGAHRFNAGENRDVAVELQKPTEEGKIYYAMLHFDDGDRQFHYQKDLPLTGPEGNTIMMRFVATSKSEPL